MSLIRRRFMENLQRVLLAVLVVVGLALITLLSRAAWRWYHPSSPVTVYAGSSATATPSTPAPEAGALVQETVIPTAAPLFSWPHWLAAPVPTGTVETPVKVGIVAGHWESDSGAVCPDGLTEVEINLDIARRVVSLLAQSGYDVEMLSEFSDKLDGYQAAVLVSIHADSCNVPEATGFKVARVSSSRVPDLEDQLVACLIERYHEATGLSFHRNSITYDMTEYHAFYEIAPETPAAIIEIGFMSADRDLLTKKQDRVARGIVNGIKCFIESTH
jgi:N-acetylmuramoyl-L-alanine amidase